MPFRLRPFEAADYPRVAELLSQASTEPVTAQELQEVADHESSDTRRHRIVAVEEDNRVVGYGCAVNWGWTTSGRFFIDLVTDTARQRQGIGSALLTAVEQYIQEQNGRMWTVEVRDSDPESRAFAERRGYVLDRHIYESTLELGTFDASRFAGVVAGVEAGGIRFLTLAERSGEDGFRKVHELISRTVLDIPGYDEPGFMPFDVWRKWIVEGVQIQPRHFLIAADGDKFVGLTMLRQIPETNAMYTWHTSVDRAYRGRSLALALKLLSIQVARREGAPYMRTNNDSQNAPMLAINRKLGYVPAPGFYELNKQ